jgi:HEAT repeat protein
VRREVAEALGALRFKRSFSTLAKALRSEESEVRNKAAEAISNLYFPHAFDRLRRIFEARDLPDPQNARTAAVRAIGRINTVEALDFLCDRLREGDEDYVKHVLPPYIRQQIDLVPPHHRSALEDAAARLGGG